MILIMTAKSSLELKYECQYRSIPPVKIRPSMVIRHAGYAAGRAQKNNPSIEQDQISLTRSLLTDEIEIISLLKFQINSLSG